MCVLISLRNQAFVSSMPNAVVMVVGKIRHKLASSCFDSKCFYSSRPVQNIQKSRVPKMFECSNLKVNSKESFKFLDYDCLGFDLDNTICRYKVSNMVKLEYKCLANFLIKERGYSGVHLNRPIEEHIDFMIKGLILDVERGNLLRIAPDGHILHGTHGTKKLDDNELTSYYGTECRWETTTLFSQNPLKTWNGPYSKVVRPLLDYFDMPAGLIFARAVDTIDEENGCKLEKYNIYSDILDALQDMFHKDNFSKNTSEYFTAIKEHPSDYIQKCSANMMDWLVSLKKQKKVLFLITGSHVDFASFTSTHCMGPNWKDLFDIVICFAKKPGFFTDNRPFIGVEGFKETEEVTDLQTNGVYLNGNWAGMHKFLQQASKKNNPKVLYVGDNLIQDVYTPAVNTTCDVVAVCEELEAEGIFGHSKNHTDQDLLVSNIWGSYFHRVDEFKETIWCGFIKKHAKLCIPSLEYVAQHQIDHEF
ncbi:PREDICTED: 5'-nucleotidase domain-containing protein 1 [Nicrophorus vespilloides]|uniref:5'-nucleotidase domain-containing protein 1 n=1 Tax=Nicrophorus vespilloides TaxID=110193 RepID=A0ABM1NA25_NICVS|nr:PREDICTED: 5'-nucleotidase domain-containing protein 1 [Nicrophorus vespilloides]